MARMSRRSLFALPVVLPLAVIAAPAAAGVFAGAKVRAFGQGLGGGGLSMSAAEYAAAARSYFAGYPQFQRLVAEITSALAETQATFAGAELDPADPDPPSVSA